MLSKGLISGDRNNQPRLEPRKRVILKEDSRTYIGGFGAYWSAEIHPPTGANDGDAIVTGTGSNAFGPASWAADATSGQDACAGMGLACVAAYALTGDGTDVGCPEFSGPRVIFCR